MQIKITTNFSNEDQPLYDAVLKLTDPINETYNHTAWYNAVFLPGLKKGERTIIALMHKNEVLGCALLKKTTEESKICALFVDPSYRGMGLATLLMEKSLATFDKPPLITVSSRNISQLKRLLENFNFELIDTVPGAYKQEDTEYYFKIPSSKHIASQGKLKTYTPAPRERSE